MSRYQHFRLFSEKSTTNIFCNRWFFDLYFWIWENIYGNLDDTSEIHFPMGNVFQYFFSKIKSFKFQRKKLSKIRECFFAIVYYHDDFALDTNLVDCSIQIYQVFCSIFLDFIVALYNKKTFVFEKQLRFQLIYVRWIKQKSTSCMFCLQVKTTFRFVIDVSLMNFMYIKKL